MFAGRLAIGATPVPTPKQVEGPFYPVSEQADRDLDLTRAPGRSESATGEVILVRGRVLNTNGQSLPSALVDVWQANHHGRYDHPDDDNPAPLDPNFHGWGVINTDSEGVYGFKTIKPGAYNISNGGIRCRHIHFKVSGPGSKSLTTQMYFQGDPLIAQDELIKEAPEELRHLLIAEARPDAATGLPVYGFDIVLNTTT
jgi:protocatechuate 3,4-dioxygenase beta subunit